VKHAFNDGIRSREDILWDMASNQKTIWNNSVFVRDLRVRVNSYK